MAPINDALEQLDAQVRLYQAKTKPIIPAQDNLKLLAMEYAINHRQEIEAQNIAGKASNVLMSSYAVPQSTDVTFPVRGPEVPAPEGSELAIRQITPSEAPSPDVTQTDPGPQARARPTTIGEQVLMAPEPKSFLGSTVAYKMLDDFTPRVLQDAYNRSLTGMAHQIVRGGEPLFDLSDYQPNMIEDIAATALSFIMPLDAVAFAVPGGAVGRTAKAIRAGLVEKLVLSGVSEAVAERAVQKAASGLGMRAIETATRSGASLGGYGAAASALQQKAETGEIDWELVGKEGLRSSALGLILGGTVGLTSRWGQKITRLPGGGYVRTADAAGKLGALYTEMAAFGTGEAAVEGRLPTADDYQHAIALVIGLKLQGIATGWVKQRVGEKLFDLANKERSGTVKDLSDAIDQLFDDASMDWLDMMKNEPPESRQRREEAQQKVGEGGAIPIPKDVSPDIRKTVDLAKKSVYDNGALNEVMERLFEKGFEFDAIEGMNWPERAYWLSGGEVGWLPPKAGAGMPGLGGAPESTNLVETKRFEKQAEAEKYYDDRLEEKPSAILNLDRTEDGRWEVREYELTEAPGVAAEKIGSKKPKAPAEIVEKAPEKPPEQRSEPLEAPTTTSAPKPAEAPKAKEAAEKLGIGTNSDGETVFTDEVGNRYVQRGSLRISAPVVLDARGVPRIYDAEELAGRGSYEFLTREEYRDLVENKEPTADVSQAEVKPNVTEDVKKPSVQAGETDKPGVQGISPDRDAEGGKRPAGTPTAVRPAKGGTGKPDADVSKPESTTRDDLPGDRVPAGAVEVAGGETAPSPRPTVPGDRNDGVVPTPPRSDRPTREPSLDKDNYDLRDKPNVVLPKGQRQQINDRAKQILEEDRPLTPEDAEILRQYTGEGGLSSGTKEALNQHYTDYETVRAIYDALDGSGFKFKTALEPAVGAGSFVGNRPKAKWTTVDIDETNHKVASKLYPKADHYNLSYEQYTGSGFDLVISNVPFLEVRGKGGLKVRPDIKALHDFYFVHSLDRVRDDGLIAFVTSKGTMDKADSKTRQEIIEKADVIGAYRLPQAHFGKTAHTDVITDVIFLQKRPEGAEPGPEQKAKNDAFVNSVVKGNGLRISGFYDKYPESILGNLVVGKDKLYGGRPAYVVEGPAQLDRMNIEYKPYKAGALEVPDSASKYKEFVDWARENDVFYRDNEDPNYSRSIEIDQQGNLLVARPETGFSDVSYKVKIYDKIGGEVAEKVSLLDKIANRATQFQMSGSEVLADQGLATIGEYKEKFGKHPSKDGKLKGFFKGVNEESYLLELGSYFSKDFTPTDVFYGKTRYSGSGKIEVAQDSPLRIRAFASENNKGIIDLNRETEIREKDIPALLGEGYAILEYVRGEKPTLQSEALYYSGNIYEKIDAAHTALDQAKKAGNEQFTRKIEAQIAGLEATKPETKPIDDIRLKGTEPWLHRVMDPYRELGLRKVVIEKKGAPPRVEWEASSWPNGASLNRDQKKILENHLNNRALVTRRTNSDTGWVEPMRDYMERLRDAEEFMDNWFDKLRDQIKRDPAKLETIESGYNRTYRNYVKPNYEKAGYLIRDVLEEIGEHSNIRLRKNQIAWVVQAVYEGKGINAHDVGAGKTMAAITLGRALKRKGIANKPIYVVPAKTIVKWGRETKGLFPDAKIVNLGRLSKDKRAETLFNLANTNADFTFISHEGFTKLKLPLEKEREYIQDLLREHIDDVEVGGRAKGLLEEKMERYEAALEAAERDTRLTFDKLGIDAIIADEAHAYKNIGVRADLVKFGIGTAFGINENEKTGNISLASARSYDFRFKSNYVTDNNNGRNVFLLSATPAQNKPMELYTMLRHLDKNIFAEYGITTDRDFASMFFDLGTVENVAKGKPQLVLRNIVNAQELRGIMNRFIDFLPMDEMPWIKIPEERAIEHFLDQSDQYALVAEDLKFRQENLPPKPGPGDDRIITVFTSARAASVDPRVYYAGEHGKGVTVHIRSHDVKDDKLEFTIQNVAKIAKGNKEAGQLIFLENPGHEQVNRGILQEDLHTEIKRELVETHGFKSEQVAIINGKVVTNPQTGKEVASGDKDQRKQDVSDAFNRGKVKVVIGGTASMGEGMDLNKKTTDIWHVDIPYKPGEYRQRNGRGLRYGNENPFVNIHYLFQAGTFDALSFQLVHNKKGWIDAMFNKEVADIIPTAEEFVEGAMPKQEQIIIQLEKDPIRRRELEVQFEFSHKTEQLSDLRSSIRGYQKRVSQGKALIDIAEGDLVERERKLRELVPDEKIKDEEKRQEQYDKSKGYLDRLIRSSREKIANTKKTIERFNSTIAQEEKAAAKLQAEVQEYGDRYFNSANEFRLPEDEIARIRDQEAKKRRPLEGYESQADIVDPRKAEPGSQLGFGLGGASKHTILPTRERALRIELDRAISNSEKDLNRLPNVAMGHTPKDLGPGRLVLTPTFLAGAIPGMKAKLGLPMQLGIRAVVGAEINMKIDQGRRWERTFQRALDIVTKKEFGKDRSAFVDVFDGKPLEDILARTDISDQAKEAAKILRKRFDSDRAFYIHHTREKWRASVTREITSEYREANDLQGKRLNAEQRAEIADMVEDRLKELVPDSWGIRDYLPHIFPGNFRIFRLSGEKRENKEFVSSVKVKIDAMRTIAEDFAKQRKNGNVDVDYYVDTRLFMDPDVVRISRPRQMVLAKELSEAAGLSQKEIKEAMRGKIGAREAKQKHFFAMKHRQGFSGYSKDLEFILDTYNRGWTRWRHLTQLNEQIQPLIRQVYAEGRPNAAKYLEWNFEQLWGYQTWSSRSFDAFLAKLPWINDRVKPFMLDRIMGMAKNVTYKGLLGFSPRFHLLNRMQTYQTLMPLVSVGDFVEGTRLYNSKDGKDLLKKYGVGYLTSGKIGEATSGTVQQVRLREKLRGLAPETFNQEKAWLTMLSEARQQGYSEKDAAQYAFLRGNVFSQFAFLQSDRPMFTRGPIASTAFLFQRFPIKNLELGYTLLQSKNMPGFAKWLGAHLLLGGTKSFDWAYSGPLKLAGKGYIPYALYKKLLDEDETVANLVFFGLPSLIGLDLSYSIDMANIPFGDTWYEKLGNALIGPVGNITYRTWKDATNTKGTIVSSTERAARSVVKSTPGLRWMLALEAIYSGLDEGVYNFKTATGKQQFAADLKQAIVYGLGGRNVESGATDIKIEAAIDLAEQYDKVVDGAALEWLNSGEYTVTDDMRSWNELWPEAQISRETIRKRKKARANSTSKSSEERALSNKKIRDLLEGF